MRVGRSVGVRLAPAAEATSRPAELGHVQSDVRVCPSVRPSLHHRRANPSVRRHRASIRLSVCLSIGIIMARNQLFAVGQKEGEKEKEGGNGN